MKTFSVILMILSVLFTPYGIAFAQSKAIIVAGGGPYAGNNLWGATEMNANFAFRSLLHQGYTKDKIHYLSPNTSCDVDGDGKADVDADANNANVNYAITTWAKDAGDLFIYMTGHGGVGNFRIGGFELLSATDFDNWLDTIQETVPGNVVIMIDSCRSGSFVSLITPPSGKERAVVTSAASDQEAMFASSGTLSFSYLFWAHMFNGDSFYQSYVYAKDGIAVAYPDRQNSQIEANGNGIANEKDDNAMASVIKVGNEDTSAGYLPTIGSVSEAQTLTTGTSAQIWAKDVIDSDGISKVWAVITPPDYTSSPDDPVTELPTINLTFNSDRYEGTYESFTTSGTYNIAIFAEDNQGYRSLPVQTTVELTGQTTTTTTTTSTTTTPSTTTSTTTTPSTTSTSGTTTTTLATSKTIIVAGGPISGNNIWDGVKMISSYAFRALGYQGYAKDNVFFISPDTLQDADGDGIPDVNAPADKANIETAIKTWAKGTNQLFLYMIGHGGAGNFKLDTNKYVSSAELNDWLDDFQASGSKQVVVLYDACYSGSFLPNFAAPAGSERILATSTRADDQSLLLVDGTLSFSYMFWANMWGGNSFYNSFSKAKDSVNIAFCDPNTNQPRMNPQLDGNGNGIPNEKEDKTLASLVKIGSILSMGDIPTIGEIRPSHEIYAGMSSAIWVKGVDALEGVQRVWAVITPPNYTSSPDSPVTDLPIQELYQGADRWEGTYGGFAVLGKYNVAVFVEDKKGFLSIPKQSMVTVVSSDPPPTAAHVHPTDASCGGNAPCYATIQNAINSEASGTLIKIFGGKYETTFTLNDAKVLTLSGGWNDGFSEQTGDATIIKAPKATQGSLTLQNVNIRP